MTTAAIKEQLYKYIEQSDDKHLEAIYVANPEELYQCRDNHLSGISKSYTADEAISSIRNSMKK